MRVTNLLVFLGQALLLTALVVHPASAQATVKQFRILELGGLSGESIDVAYIAPFTEKTGIKVSRETPASLGKLQAMVQSQHVTSVLVELSAIELALARSMGLVEPLDWELINPQPMFEEARLPDGFGWQYFSTIMAWRDGAQPLQSWADFWDVTKFPGKRSLPDYPAYALPIALLADGVRPEDLYPLDVDRAFQSLHKIKDHIDVWWRAGSQAPQLLEDQEIDYAAVFSGRVMGNDKLGSTYQQGLLQPSYFAVPKGADASQKAAAMGLLHEMSLLSNQVRATEVIPYTGASPDIQNQIPAQRLSLYPTEAGNKAVQVLTDPDWTAANAADIERRWQEFKLGM